MEFKYYEQKLNDVRLKCPLEIGIEILVYNLLDSIIDKNNYSVIDINSLHQNMDSRLDTSGGISDIAILSKDFIYKLEEKGKSYGFIEVKSTENNLEITKQIKGQKGSINHFIYTNGKVWKYYDRSNEEWSIDLIDYNTKYTIIDGQKYLNIKEEHFNNLLNKLKNIKWNT